MYHTNRPVLGFVVIPLLVLLAWFAPLSAADWPRYSFDAANTNHNPEERDLTAITARHLKRAWQTFNDDSAVTEPRPAGFVLESVLGLEFPAAVVGVIASPLIADGTIYYVDALGTVF
ncbi:MAG: hypothetical protein ACR2P1_02755, partial [Pseudomonadales bacterium]